MVFMILRPFRRHEFGGLHWSASAPVRSPRVTHSLSRIRLPRKFIMAVRVPMQVREIAIIKHMHKVVNTPILQIARAAVRHRKGIYRALKAKK